MPILFSTYYCERDSCLDKWVGPVTEFHALILQQVKQSVSGAKVSPKVAGLLERIAEYHNIPRKKAKFEVLWILWFKCLFHVMESVGHMKYNGAPLYRHPFNQDTVHNHGHFEMCTKILNIFGHLLN